MTTTQFYVELIAIGLESSIWMGVFLVNIMGKKIINVFDKISKDFLSSLFFIGVLYIIGIIMEGLAEMIFQTGEDKIRKNSGLEAVNTHLIWEKNNADKYSDYTRSKIRILRASILNMPLIMVAFLWYTFRHYKELNMIEMCILVIYIFVIGMASTIICLNSHYATVTRYYKKAHDLEKSEKKTDQS